MLTSNRIQKMEGSRTGREIWLMSFIRTLALRACRCWTFLGWKKSMLCSKASLPNYSGISTNLFSVACQKRLSRESSGRRLDM